MRRGTAVAGAALVTAATLTACGDSTSSYCEEQETRMQELWDYETTALIMSRQLKEQGFDAGDPEYDAVFDLAVQNGLEMQEQRELLEKYDCGEWEPE